MNLSGSSFTCLFLDSLYVSPAQSLDFASELEVTADLVVGQDAEAVDYGSRLPDGLHNLIRIKIHVG